MTDVELLQAIGGVLGSVGAIMGTTAAGIALTWLATRRETSVKLARSDSDLRDEFRAEIAADRAEIRQLRQDLRDANLRNDELAELVERQLAQLKESEQATERLTGDYEAQVRVLTAQMEALRAQVGEYRAQIGEYKAQNALLTAQVEALQQELTSYKAEQKEGA